MHHQTPVARNLQVHVTTRRDWSSETSFPSEKHELIQLRKDIAVLKMEREILTRAATFFAKESR